MRKSKNPTEQFKIEKNVPMPVVRGKSIYPWASLEPGDSIVIPKRSRQAAYLWASSHGIKVTVHVQPDGTCRVWRVS